MPVLGARRCPLGRPACYSQAADIGKRIDDALALIELENPKLKGILDKRYARAQLPDGKLGELVDLVSTIGFGNKPDQARDVLSQVYEYFVGQFASAEGKKGGQFYTPASIVKTLVTVLAPYQGKVYDPCCGSGGMFVQSEKFIQSHGGRTGDVSIYGQEFNPTTWRLAAMSLAIRGIDFNLGKEPGDIFTRNQHLDLRADYILTNPPFNITDWWHGSLEGDPRWVYGTPPQGSANYAWLQHMLHHLRPTGRAGVVLANGSMSSSQNSEGKIRAAMVQADVVEVMVALTGQLFFNTQVPACLWFLTKAEPAHRKGGNYKALMADLTPERKSSCKPPGACGCNTVMPTATSTPTPRAARRPVWLRRIVCCRWRQAGRGSWILSFTLMPQEPRACTYVFSIAFPWLENEY